MSHSAFTMRKHLFLEILISIYKLTKPQNATVTDTAQLSTFLTFRRRESVEGLKILMYVTETTRNNKGQISVSKEK